MRLLDSRTQVRNRRTFFYPRSNVGEENSLGVANKRTQQQKTKSMSKISKGRVLPLSHSSCSIQRISV